MWASSKWWYTEFVVFEVNVPHGRLVTQRIGELSCLALMGGCLIATEWTACLGVVTQDVGSKAKRLWIEGYLRMKRFPSKASEMNHIFIGHDFCRFGQSQWSIYNWKG
jgi:hypothetical protein